MEYSFQASSGEKGPYDIRKPDLQQMRSSEHIHHLIHSVKDIQEQVYTNHHSCFDTNMSRYYDVMHEGDCLIEYDITYTISCLSETDPYTMCFHRAIREPDCENFLDNLV